VLQRGDAVLVSDGSVCSGRDEDAHDLLVPRSAVPEDHRLQQGSPAEVVDVVDVDPGLDDAAHVLDMSPLAGRDQGHATEPVANGQIRVRRQQRLQHRDASRHAGDQPWCVVLGVHGVRVRAERDEDAGDVDMLVRHGEQQRCAAPIVCRLLVGVHAEREGDAVRVAGRGGGQEPSVGLRLVDRTGSVLP
jgi:hypothetical protein